ncbi:MAG TPA: mechanosensitive ion channel [Desulfobacteraceae bacterium]|nr:mechanosensitive ion channel [Desulfobacteraceae bacterium]
MFFRASFRSIPILALIMLVFFISPESGAAAPGESSGKESVNESSSDSIGFGGRLMIVVSDKMGRLTGQLSEAAHGIFAVPELIQGLAVRARDPQNLLLWAEMAGKVALVLVAGFLAGWLARRLLSRTHRAVVDRKTDRLPIRLLLAAARTVLDILPVVAFGMVAYGVLPLTDPRYETRLVALMLINANVLARIVLVVSNVVLVPRAPSLRLLPVGDENAFYLYLWIRRAAGLAIYGYFILETALLMGMPGGLHLFLMKFLGFAITLMLVMLVMQNKNSVSKWLRQDRPPADEEVKAGKKPSRRWAIGSFTRRFADVWHIAAIIIVLGIYLTWLLEIEGGLAFLLSGFAWTAFVLALAGFLVRMIHRGVDRLFQVSHEIKTAFPGLEERANRYLPFVTHTLKAVVWVIAVFSILEAWGLGTLRWLFSPSGGYVVSELVILAVIIIGAFVLWEVVSMLIERSLTRETEKEFGSTRKLTLLPLLRNVVRITLGVIATMLVLSQIGINIGPLLAGAGVVGLAVGFGAQTLVRDVITGAFILLEDAISVGDWVTAGGFSGSVEGLNVRTVTLRDLSGTVHVIPFSQVTSVTNFNRGYGYALIDVSVAYRERYDEVVQALHEVAKELRQDETWGRYITGDLEVFGLNNLGDSAVEIRVRMKTLPMRQFGVRRAFLEKMKRMFDERGIEIPFPHRTVWFGVDKGGTAPPLYFAERNRKAITPPGDEPPEQ